MFSLVFLLSSIAVVKKHTIIVLSFLSRSLFLPLSLFSFHKDLSTARGALWLLLGSQILLFLFSLPAAAAAAAAAPPHTLSFPLKRTLTGVCSELFIFHYLALSCLLTPRVSAFQRSIILCFYGCSRWRDERIETHTDRGK